MASNVSAPDYATRENELEKLERSLESLTKLANPACRSSNRATSAAQKKDNDGSPADPSAESLPQFQSLQTHVSDYSTSTPSSCTRISQQVLHPLTSSTLSQNIRNASVKNTFNRVPLVNPPCGQYLKKLDRNVVLDAVFMNVEPVGQNHLLAPSWLQHGQKKNEKKTDEFSLPNVPGGRIIRPFFFLRFSLILVFQPR